MRVFNFVWIGRVTVLMLCDRGEEVWEGIVLRVWTVKLFCVRSRLLQIYRCSTSRSPDPVRLGRCRKK